MVFTQGSSSTLDKQIFNCHTTDAGNSQALALLSGNKLRFIHGLGWHVWNGNYWRPDNNGHAIEIVKQLAVKRQQVVSTLAKSHTQEHKKERKEYMAEAYRLENTGKAESCLKMAESATPFSSLAEQVDNDKMLLTCPNGTIDLELSKLFPSDPNNMITNCTNVSYNPDAKTFLWDIFLQDIFVTKIGTPDYQFISWLQKVLGYCLTGDIAERSIYIMFGEGANGKSTLLNIIYYIMGSYAGSAAFTHFLESKVESSNDIARLRGKRIVTAVEAGQGKFLDEVKIKQMTGGDPVTCRYLYKEYFTYNPTYKIFLACNDKPRIKGTDNAIWDRVKVIPFNVRFKDNERDKRLLDKLIDEAEGILAWMVRGCMRWQIEGLGNCQTVIDTTLAYRSEEDAFGRYYADNIHIKLGVFTSAEELWKAYNQWAKLNGEQELPSTISLGHKMRKKGYQSIVSGKTRGYKGIEI